jgi:hypothetical protein
VNARPVRIPRSGPAIRSAADRTRPYDSPLEPLLPGAERLANRAGRARASRLFTLFLIALIALYLVFVGAALASGPFARYGTPTYAFLTLVVAIAALIGWWATLGQSPRSAWLEGDDLVVLEGTGRRRRFDRSAGLEIRIVRRTVPSFIAPECTECAEISPPVGPRRTYWVGEDFFAFAQKARAAG